MKTLIKILLIGIIFLSVGYMCAQFIETSKQRAALKKSDASKNEAPVCNANQAHQYVNNIINDLGVVREIDQKDPQYPVVRVEAPWFTLNMEQKNTIDSQILCHLANGLQSQVPYLMYWDARSGEPVARSGPSGLSMD